MVRFVGDSPYGFDPTVSVSLNVDASSTLETGGALDWHGRVYVVRRPDGVMIRVWRNGTSHLDNTAELEISFSDDDGATWTADNTKLGGGSVTGFPLDVPVGNIMIGEGLPFYAPNGDLVLTTWSYMGTWAVDAVPNGTYQYRSTDGGETWALEGKVVWAGTSEDDDYIFATEQMRVINGVLYGGARFYRNDAGTSGDLWFVKNATTDGAYTGWEKVSDILTTSDVATGGQETGLVYLDDGEWLALLRDNAHTHGYTRRSLDMGETWGTLTDVTSTAGIWGRNKAYTRAELKELPNPYKDPVIVVFTFIHQTSGLSMPRRNCIEVSRDRGYTWPGPMYVDTTTDDAGYGDGFYRATDDKYVNLSNYGDLNSAVIKQYDLSIAAI